MICPYSVHARKNIEKAKVSNIIVCKQGKVGRVLGFNPTHIYLKTGPGHKFILGLPGEVLWVQTPWKPWNNLELRRTRIRIYNTFNIGLKLLNEWPISCNWSIPHKNSHQFVSHETKFTKRNFKSDDSMTRDTLSSSSFFSTSSFFLSWVLKTQPNHWTKRMANTRLAT